MIYCGMKHPAFVKIRLPKKEKEQIKHEWVAGDFDAKGNFKARAITECDRQPRVRGYRVDKPEFGESSFWSTYSQAVKILLMGNRGKGKIEAVR